jgi:hypothetical protein
VRGHLGRRLVSAGALLALTGCGADRPPPDGGGTRLYLAGDGEAWIVDVARERARHLALRDIGPGDPPHRVIRRGRRLVLHGPSTAYVAEPGLRRPLRALDRDSWFVLPSAHPERVWSVSLKPGSRPTVLSFGAVREIDTDGRVTVPDVRPPPRHWPERAFTGGRLLFAGRHDFVLWDASSGTTVRRMPYEAVGDVGPAHGDLLASCPQPCRSLRLTDVRAGGRRELAAPPGVRVEVGLAAFSPDGRWLAVPVAGDGHQLALVDVAGGGVRVVPGSRVPPGYTFVDWSADGREVFITGGERLRRRTIVAYRLGDPRARQLDVAVGDFYGMAAL